MHNEEAARADPAAAGRQRSCDRRRADRGGGGHTCASEQAMVTAIMRMALPAKLIGAASVASRGAFGMARRQQPTVDVMRLATDCAAAAELRIWGCNPAMRWRSAPRQRQSTADPVSIRVAPACGFASVRSYDNWLLLRLHSRRTACGSLFDRSAAAT